MSPIVCDVYRADIASVGKLQRSGALDRHRTVALSITVSIHTEVDTPDYESSRARARQICHFRGERKMKASHISQVNASRGSITPAREGQKERPGIPGEIIAGFDRTRAAMTKPKVNPLNAESRKRGKMWEENQTVATERSLEHERAIEEAQMNAAREASETEIKLDALRADATLHTDVAQSLAKTKQSAVAEAMHYSKNLVVYGSNLINFLDTQKNLDKETSEHCKQMVRRVMISSMVDWEAASSGIEPDRSMRGGEA